MRLDANDTLAHVRQYAEQADLVLEDALERLGLDKPVIPAGWECLWDWFWELNAGRGSNGFGPLPLTWSDMLAWASIYGMKLHPWQAHVLRGMDAAWLEEVTMRKKETTD